jgi:hypothetical protein
MVHREMQGLAHALISKQGQEDNDGAFHLTYYVGRAISQFLKKKNSEEAIYHRKGGGIRELLLCFFYNRLIDSFSFTAFLICNFCSRLGRTV